MQREPITGEEVLKLLQEMRARRRNLECTLLNRDLVVQECRKRHISDSPDGRWLALTELVGGLVEEEAARCLGIPPQRLRILAEQAGDPLFDLLRKACQDHGVAPLRLAWPYLYVRFVAGCRLQHMELEHRVRGAGISADSNHFWNQLKNRDAGPALARRLNELESAIPAAIEPRPARPSSLPAPEPGFVGRRGTRDNAAKALSESPLVTLTGPGGVGKSSLALKLAWSEEPSFPDFRDGRYWLDLSRITEPSRLPARFWQEFGQGLPLPANPMTALSAQLQSRRILLVLDNCEHLLPTLAALCKELLQSVPSLRILATSRQPLKLDEERVLRLRGLAVPPEGEREDLMGFDAVRAFVQEAQRHDAAFSLTSDKAAIVTAIVRRVDGLPLAIKLIAPWVRQLSLSEILERLDALLARGADQDRALPDRHRTLEACLQWSLDSLAALDREVFLQLAVFQGGFSLDAVAAVCLAASGPLDDATALELMSRLIDLSLVEVDTSAAQTRGRLLEPIRHLCLQGLNAQAGEETLRERHAAYFLALAERLEAEGEARGDHAWLDQLDTELANLHAAETWAAEQGRLETSLRLASAQWRHHQRRGLGEATLALLERGLATQSAADLPLVVRARAHNAAGSLAMLLNKDEATIRHLQAAAALLKEEPPSRLRLAVLHNLGSALMSQGHLDDAMRYFEEALSLLRPDEGRMQAALLRSLATLALWRGELRAALSYLDRSEALWLRHGNSYELALCLLTRGIIQSRLGRGRRRAGLRSLPLSSRCLPAGPGPGRRLPCPGPGADLGRRDPGPPSRSHDPAAPRTARLVGRQRGPC